MSDDRESRIQALIAKYERDPKIRVSAQSSSRQRPVPRVSSHAWRVEIAGFGDFPSTSHAAIALGMKPGGAFYERLFMRGKIISERRRHISVTLEAIRK